MATPKGPYRLGDSFGVPSIHFRFVPSSCRNSLLYKGSEDDNELRLEVTGWVWNKRIRTKTMMMEMRMRVKGSMVAVRLGL